MCIYSSPLCSPRVLSTSIRKNKPFGQVTASPQRLGKDETSRNRITALCPEALPGALRGPEWMRAPLPGFEARLCRLLVCASPCLSFFTLTRRS